MARLLRAMTGTDYVPRFERLERLMDEILFAADAGAGLTRTLAGVSVQMPASQSGLRRQRLWMFAEAGRHGFNSVALHPGETHDWEHRVRLSLSGDAPEPVMIRALGQSARRLLETEAPAGVPGAALATLASAWRGNDLVGVIGLPPGRFDPASVLITGSELVAGRLRSRSVR